MTIDQPIPHTQRCKKIEEELISVITTIKQGFSEPETIPNEMLDFFEELFRLIQSPPENTNDPDKVKIFSIFQHFSESLGLPTNPSFALESGATSSNASKVTEAIDQEELAELRFDTRLLPLGEIMENVRQKKWLTRFDLFPETQTNTSWPPITQSRWIESLMLALPLPPLWFEIQHDDRWLLYDGEQRIQACRSFLLEKSLTLQGLEFFPQYEGKYYDELPRFLQRRILESRWMIHTIEKGSTRQAKYALIRRLQTNSSAFTNQIAREMASNPRVRSFLQQIENKLQQESLVAYLPKATHPRERIGLAFLEPTTHPPNKEHEDRLFEWMGQLETLPDTQLQNMLRDLLAKLRQEKTLSEEKQQQDLLAQVLLGAGALALAAYLAKK